MVGLVDGGIDVLRHLNTAALDVQEPPFRGHCFRHSADLGWYG